MARITLKITKPVDRNAPPKALTTRAKRALHGKALRKAPSSVPALEVPAPGSVSATDSTPAASGRTTSTPARSDDRLGNTPGAGVRRASTVSADARGAATPSSPAKRAQGIAIRDVIAPARNPHRAFGWCRRSDEAHLCGRAEAPVRYTGEGDACRWRTAIRIHSRGRPRGRQRDRNAPRRRAHRRARPATRIPTIRACRSG